MTDGTFDMATITGTGFTYDPITGTPIGGIVGSIVYGHQIPEPSPGAYFFTTFSLTRLGLSVNALDSVGWTNHFGVADLFLGRIETLPPTASQELTSTYGEYAAYGGTSNDRLVGGGAGFSSGYVFGGEGDDIIAVVGLGGGSNYLDGGAGNDIIRGGLGENQIDGGSGNDRLFGAAYADNIVGGDGNDQIDGGLDADIVQGGNGNDLIFGGAGDDFLLGDFGSDRVYGGAGNDSIQAYAEVNFVAVNDHASNSLYGGAGDDFISESFGADFIRGGDGDDTIVGGTRLSAESTVDRIYGDAGNDRISGGGGNDFSYGGDGNDVIEAYVGNDWLFGGNGNDLVITVYGNDTLTGGSGRDFFVFYDAPGEISQNRVTDFNVLDDRMQVFGFEGGPNPPPLTLGSFLAHAVQTGAVVVYTHTDGSTTTFNNLVLTDLTATNFAY